MPVQVNAVCFLGFSEGFGQKSVIGFVTGTENYRIAVYVLTVFQVDTGLSKGFNAGALIFNFALQHQLKNFLPG